MLKKLTLKQEKFANYYIELGNATEAAIKAGYSKNSARAIAAENLTKPNVKKYIENRLKEIQDKSIAKQEEILQTLTEIMRSKGIEETKDRIKSAELLGKYYNSWDGIKENKFSSKIVITESTDKMQEWIDENE